MTAEEMRGAQERPPRGAAERTGLYFCRCGPNLGHVVALGELDDASRWPAAADVATHSILCSPEGRSWLGERIRAHGLGRVVIAACSPREHEQTFRAVLAAEGLSPFHLQMVNLREQVEWVGGDAGAATERGRRLVRAALARVALHRALPAEEIEVSPDVLVIGSGPAGVSAALALAGKRRRVVVVERAFAVGGLANQLDQVFPDLECASCFMEPVLDRVLHHECIEVLTGAEVRRVRGAAGRFEVEIALRPRRVDPGACIGCDECAKACPAERPDPLAGGLSSARAIGLAYRGCLPNVAAIDRDACLRERGERCEACAGACPFGAVRLDEEERSREVTVGAIVVATGLAPGEVAGPRGLISSYQLERMLHPDGPTRGEVRGAGGERPRRVLLAAEGEDELGALEVLKLAQVVKARLPDAEVAVAGDLGRVPQLRGRAAGLSQQGIALLPGRLVAGGVSSGGGALAVRLAGIRPSAEPLFAERNVPARSLPATQYGPKGEETIHRADLVVLHPAAWPAAGTDALARLLRISTGPGGFLLDCGASPFEPTATRIAGVHVAGAAAGPRPIAEAIRDGIAAAGLVHASLVPGERRPLEPLSAEVDEARCGGCGVCATACPFGAIQLVDAGSARLDEDGSGAGARADAQGTARRARVEAVHCRGCGTCAAACPTGAASARHFTRAQVAAEISGLLRSRDLAAEGGK